jgi:hypothetical protein
VGHLLGLLCRVGYALGTVLCLFCQVFQFVFGSGAFDGGLFKGLGYFFLAASNVLQVLGNCLCARLYGV